jgi:hypothetical protein
VAGFVGTKTRARTSGAKARKPGYSRGTHPACAQPQEAAPPSTCPQDPALGSLQPSLHRNTIKKKKKKRETVVKQVFLFLTFRLCLNILKLACITSTIYKEERSTVAEM